MPSYCCFIDPEKNYEERSLDDLCPKCGRKYGFPLINYPDQIADYKIVKPLARGFYSASYVAKTSPFNIPRVIKVVSKNLYDFFRKNFEFECREHARAAEGSRHIVRIYNMELNIDVTYGDVNIPCHIAEIDYVDGKSLRSYLKSDQQIQAIDIAQIAMDLFTLMGELQNKEVFHNDLQPENLIVETLCNANKRADAESPFINLVGIDLNSITDKSKSDPKRLGDLRWVVTHLRMLVDKLLHPDKTRELDYRIASILEEQAYILSPDTTSQRTPTFDECIADIKSAVRKTIAPWKEPLQLRRFSDAYNAQTLDPWFVPYLLVDPDKQWLSAISMKGPQIITGMRGCGKTMLLKALEFHARAIMHKNGRNADIIGRLQDDGYVGIYVSSTKILEIEVKGKVHSPFEKIYVTFALEALRALKHLRDLDKEAVFPEAYQLIGKAVSEYLRGAEKLSDIASEFSLESALLKIMVKLNRGESNFSLDVSPSLVFQHLAEAINNCSPIWQNATIFFLLDDVSTRYLTEPNIKKLMSALIFSHPKCAFKITTEAQTFELTLRSPGSTQALEGRDYDRFDLGGKVNELTKVGSKSGIDFVENILQQRSKYYPQSHINGLKASRLLGDTTLKSIALNIGKTAATSIKRKEAYWGITVLTSACVGDIGDVIRIYESMLIKAKGKQFPISHRIQTQCYHDFCNARSHDLNRKKSWLKDHTLAFAQASYDLLKQSYRDYVANGNKGRIRQYVKIYVQIKVGDTDKQLKQIRELIDAGVFVLDGGAYRKKTRDSDPVRQFVLTYRKLYGLSNFIGLSERDRFEPPSDEIENWLDNPNKEILKRHRGQEDEESDERDMDKEVDIDEVKTGINMKKHLEQPTLWQDEVLKVTEFERDKNHQEKIAFLLREKTPICRQVKKAELSSRTVDTLVLALGFEERTVASVQRILSATKPKKIICFKHDKEGRAREILDLVNKHASESYVMTYEEFLESPESALNGQVMVDVTGLSKSMIFHSVRNAILNNNHVLICHTKAQVYYPIDNDIAAVLKAKKAGDYYVLLEEMGKIFTGEIKPYSLVPLLSSDADNTRRRILFAFASAKHERLLSLLDSRDYDNVQIVTQNTDTNRGKLASLSVEFAIQNYPNTETFELRTNDLPGAIEALLKSYHFWYIDQGFNFEVGLTGSKIQAVACAVVSAIFKFSQGWYVRPKEFDSQRFTKGVGKTNFFEISLLSNAENN